jgi:hypothetical protein
VAADAGEFDALIECSVRRDAIEMEKLEGSEAECDDDGLSEALIWALQEWLDAGVEGDLPAERAEHERSGEVAVFRGELCGVRGVQEVVTIALPCRDKHEDFECSETRGRDRL